MATKKLTANKFKKCTCVKKVNKKLEPQGLELDDRIIFDSVNKKITLNAPIIRLRWKEPCKKKVPPMFAIYCPFCGEKLDSGNKKS